jgi:hypothetical protein
VHRSASYNVANGLIFACLATLMATTGCGGGGSAGSAAPSAPTPPVISPSVSLETSAIQASGYAAGFAPSPASIQVSIANPPANELEYLVTVSGAGISAASFSWQSAASGTLIITFQSSSQLGPGTYKGSVQLSVCQDAACTDPIGGSPAVVSVTYTVYAGSPSTTFTIEPGPGGVVSPLYTSQKSPVVFEFSIYITNPPDNNLFVVITQPPGGYAVSGSIEPETGPTVTIGVNLKSPASLGSGIYSENLTFSLCYDEQCENPVTAPVIEPLDFVVSLTKGVEYNIQSVSLNGASDVAWDSANQQLYAATITAPGKSYSDSLVQIDPVTGAIGPMLAFPVGLQHLAMADDGSYAYVSSRDQPTIYRVVLPALTSDLQIPLGSGSFGANSVNQMQVAPGNPQTIAVSFGEGGSTANTTGLAIFDDAVQRPNILPTLNSNGSPAVIGWGSSSAVLYALRQALALPADLSEFDILNVDASGISVATAIQNSTFSPGDQIYYATGRLYDDYGVVRDASTYATLGQFMIPSALGGVGVVLPDLANSRVFFLMNSGASNRLTLLCYDPVTFALISLTDLGVDPGYNPPDMILWGTDGIAFVDGLDSVQILSGGFGAGSMSASAVKRTTANFHAK